MIAGEIQQRGGLYSGSSESCDIMVVPFDSYQKRREDYSSLVGESHVCSSGVSRPEGGGLGLSRRILGFSSISPLQSAICPGVPSPVISFVTTLFSLGSAIPPFPSPVLFLPGSALSLVLIPSPGRCIVCRLIRMYQGGVSAGTAIEITSLLDITSVDWVAMFQADETESMPDNKLSPPDGPQACLEAGAGAEQVSCFLAEHAFVLPGWRRFRGLWSRGF